MAQKCVLCNLDFKNDEQLKQHLDGKKHKKFESIREEREKSAQRSLFVSHLKKGTFQKHLEEHFVQFGKIHKIINEPEKNSYAIVEFEEEKSVENALACAEHKVNGKNLKISRREMKEFVPKISTNMEKKKEALEKMKEEALAINTILGRCESFDEQVQKLIDYLKLNEDNLKLRKAICEKLNRIFASFWTQNEVKVSIFGSTENGLACNGSDMDFTLLFNKYFPDNSNKQQKVPKIKLSQKKVEQDNSDSNMADLEEDVELDENEDDEQNDQTLKDSIIKFFTEKKYDQFLNLDVEHQIKIIAKIVQRQMLDIKSLRTITNTRCPVVRFFHDDLNIFCDLSLNNYLAVENTKLIKLYMDLEPNLRRMIFVVRYWLKQKNLYSSSRFNSYTAIWLIIFYMQKNMIGHLPTVQKLSQLTNEVNQIHGWNCAFEKNLEKIRSVEMTRSTLINAANFNDLLKGFFEFYSNFQFSSDLVLNTRTASLTADAELKSELSKLSPFMNIQDPFDLSHNLTGNVSKNTVDRFLTECRASNELLAYSATPKKSATKCWGLILLMTKKSLPILTSTKTTQASNLVEKSLVKLKLDDSELPTEITVKKAIDFVLFLFKNCLLFDQLSEDSLSKKRKLKTLKQICDKVDLLELNCSPKRLKVANNEAEQLSAYVCVLNESVNNNESGEEKEVASYEFCIASNTWQGRRAKKRELQQSMGKSEGFEMEKLISEKLAENAKSGKKIHFRILFSVNEEKTMSNSNFFRIKFDLLDDVENQSDLINFATLVHFLDIYINNSHEKLFNQWLKLNAQS